LACLALLTSVALGCSGGDDEDAAGSTTAQEPSQEYCDAWSDLIAAFEAYEEIDIVNGGLDSVRTYFDDLEQAAAALQVAAGAQLGDEVDAFTVALDELGTTLTSTSLPVDRSDLVSAATDAVDVAWNDLVAAFSAGCPSVTATTVEPGASR
jgi:hypothetical protein